MKGAARAAASAVPQWVVRLRTLAVAVGLLSGAAILAHHLNGHDGDAWPWVTVHGVFTLAAAAAVIASWGLNENVRRTAAATEEALRGSERRLLEEQATLRMVAGVARDIATKEDARASICAATREALGSSFASLWEVEGESLLILTAVEGVEIGPDFRMRIGKEPSGAAVAFLSGKRYFAADARDNPTVSPRMIAATGARSLLFEPVRRGEHVIGVIAIGWTRQISSLSPRDGSVVRLLADEAAVAIERSDMLAQLAALARTDPLTGLANRRVWEERLPVEIARAERTGDALSLLVMDFDDFKSVNDAHGHQAGDRMLKEVAASWRGVTRPTDLLARFGGDEFVVLAPGCPAAAGVALADRLRAAMPRGLTCSVGVVEWSGDGAEAFLARGDAALYEAKTQGRDRTAAR